MPPLKLGSLGLLIFVAGCATHPDRSANDGPDLRCQKIELTGTMLTRTVCITRAQRADHQAQLEDLRQKVQSAAGADPRPVAPTAQ